MLQIHILLATLFSSGFGFCLSLWCWSGSGSCLSLGCGPVSYLPNKDSKPGNSAQIGSYSKHFGLSSASWCRSGSGSSLLLWCGYGSYLSIWCGSGSATLVQAVLLQSSVISCIGPTEYGVKIFQQLLAINRSQDSSQLKRDNISRP